MAGKIYQFVRVGGGATYSNSIGAVLDGHPRVVVIPDLLGLVQGYDRSHCLCPLSVCVGVEVDATGTADFPTPARGKRGVPLEKPLYPLLAGHP